MIQRACNTSRQHPAHAIAMMIIPHKSDVTEKQSDFHELTCPYIHKPIRLHVHTPMRPYVYMSKRLFVHTSTHLHIYTLIHLYGNASTHVNIYIYIYTYIYIYIYIYIYYTYNKIPRAFNPGRVRPLTPQPRTHGERCCAGCTPITPTVGPRDRKSKGQNEPTTFIKTQLLL